MSPDLANFLLETANFATLMAALGWFLFKPVRATLTAEVERQKEVERKLRLAREQAEEQERAAQSAMQRVAVATETRQKELLTIAQDQADGIRERAHAEADERLERLKADLEAERQAHLATLADTIGRVAAEAVRELMSSLQGPSVDLALIQKARTELGTLRRVGDDVVVHSARPLDAEGRATLSAVLGPGFQERVDTLLGAGVRITTSEGQVDASASGIARHVASEVSALVRQSTGAAPRP